MKTLLSFVVALSLFSLFPVAEAADAKNVTVDEAAKILKTDTNVVVLDVHLGFGFSAGLFDYVLNFSRSTRPWLLLPIGLLYLGVYYGLFRFFIVRFDLKTLGR